MLVFCFVFLPLKLSSQKHRLKPFVFCPHGLSDRLRQNREPSSPISAFAHILCSCTRAHRTAKLRTVKFCFPNIRTTRFESLPAFRSNVPFLTAMSHILFLSHSNKFLTTSWMDRDGCVEVGFSCFHFNGYGKALNHFVNAISNSVESDYFFVCSCCD